MAIRVQPKVDSLAYVLFVILQNQIRNDPPSVTTLTKRIQKRFPNLNLMNVPPWRVDTFTELRDVVGDLNYFLKILENAGAITPTYTNNVQAEIQEEDDIIRQAAAVAKLPERQLKYVNVSIPENLLDDETRTTLERIKQGRESARLKYVRGPTFDRYMKAYDDEEKKALNRVRQDNIQLRRRPITPDPHAEKEYEEHLVNDKRDRARKRGQLLAYKQAALKQRQKKEKEVKGYVEEQNVKQELKNRSRATRPPAPLLQVNIEGRNIAPSGHKSVTGLAHANFIDSTSGSIDHAKMKDETQRRGAELLDAYDAKRNLLEADLETVIATELAANGCTLNGAQRRDIAHSIADDIAEVMIEDHEDSLEVGAGLLVADTNVRRSIKEKAHDTKFRTRLTAQMMKSLMDVDPSVTSASHAAGIVHAWIDPVITAASQSNRLADVKTTFKAIGGKNNPGILVTRVYQINMGGQVHHARERLIVSQHPVNWATQTLAKVERARQKFHDIIFTPDHEAVTEEEKINMALQKRLSLQAAYAEGILDAQKELQQNPVGFVPRMVLNTAWGLAPDSLQKATIEARTGLIGVGGMLAAIPLVGPAAAPLVAGIAASHNAQLSRTQFNIKYFPILHTREWLEAYSKGKVNEFAAELFPLAKYDKKGRLLIGWHLLPATWDFMWDGIGAGVRARYRKNLFEHLTATGSMNLAKKRARNDPWMNFQNQLALRWRNKDKKRGPLSMLLIGPVWATLKAGVITVLERSGYMASVRKVFNNGFSRAWKYGAGWADEAKMLKEARNAYNALPAVEQTVANEALIMSRFKKLIWLGRFAKWGSFVWEGTKIGLGGGLRVAAVTGVAMLLGAPAPLLIGAAYGVPWAATKILSSPAFGGGLTRTGSYVPGLLARNFKALAPLTEAWQRPFLGLWSSKSNLAIQEGLKLSGWQRGLNIFGRMFPGTGMWVGLGLLQLGIPPGFALGIPIGIDLGSKIVKELARAAESTPWVTKWLAGPTSILSKITGVFGTAINIGTLAYAIEQGGVFAIFRQFSLTNLIKFLPVPATFASIAGLAIFFGVATIPALIIGAIGTAAVFLIDRILRIPAVYDLISQLFPNIEPGLWGTVFEQPVNTFLNFLKKQGFGAVGAGLSLILGLFGLIKALIAGDVQGVAISLVFLAIFGTITFIGITSSTYPSTYYTPSTGGPSTPGIEENDYIFDVKKSFISMQGDNKLTYEYTYDIDLDDEIESIKIEELDEFSNVSESDGNSVVVSPSGTYTTIGMNSHFGLDKIVSLPSDSGGITRQFTITLPKPIGDYIEEGGGFCNTLTIHIDSITIEGTEEDSDQPDVSREICIDAEGNYVSLLTHSPVSPGTPGAYISSCFGDPRPGGKTHNGLDIAAPNDGPIVPIYAAGKGIILTIGLEDGGQGNAITIDHGKGLRTEYLHMKDFAAGLRAGSSVQAGQQIGTMDSTGNSTGKHLHFTIMKNGSYYNPCLEELLKLCEIYPNTENCS